MIFVSLDTSVQCAGGTGELGVFQEYTDYAGGSCCRDAELAG